MAEPVASLKDLWAGAPQPAGGARHPRPDAATEPVRAWPIPTRYDPARLANGRVLFVGDAAGVVDPLTGEGIAQAIESGALAAEAIARGGEPDAVAASYRRAVSRALGRDLRFASDAADLVAHATRRQRRDRRRRTHAVDAPELRPLDVRGLSARLLLTPDRWRRGAFSAPGAYRVQ